MRFLAIALLGSLLAADAFGQQSLSEIDMRTAGGRNRESMHPGQPLHVVGSEQEDNGFRHLTPSLLQAERVAVLVDADENYQRRLAMYDSGERFDAAPRVHSRVLSSDPSVEVPRHEVERRVRPVEKKEEDNGNTVLLSGMALIGTLMYMIRRMS